MLRFADQERHGSLHLLSGQWEFMAAFFALQAIAAGGVMVGAPTRLVTVVSWILLVSIQNRNILILNKSDTFLRMRLFWGMMLPWGQCWSVDAARSDEEHTGSPIIFSWATVGFVLQTLTVHLFTAFLKTGDVRVSQLAGEVHLVEESVDGGALAPVVVEVVLAGDHDGAEPAPRGGLSRRGG